MLTKAKCSELGVQAWVKKPIPAYAIQITEDNRHLLNHEERLDFDNQTITTLEGQFHFEYGDYMVLGNEDEIWSVKQSIFEATYEQV